VESQVRDLEASDVKRLNGLEHETSRLTRLFADLSLGNEALKDLIEKQGLPLPQAKLNRPRRKACVMFLTGEPLLLSNCDNAAITQKDSRSIMVVERNS